jgi:hypothetical protein
MFYGNTPGLTMRVGQRVRWYVMGSTNFEFHAPHWHGNVVVTNHMRTDVGMLLPMGMFVADMVPDNPGKWFFHCHVRPPSNGHAVGVRGSRRSSWRHADGRAAGGAAGGALMTRRQHPRQCQVSARPAAPSRS